MWNGQTNLLQANAEEMDNIAGVEQTACAVLENEWDNPDESENGIDSLLWIVGDQDRPRPWWER